MKNTRSGRRLGCILASIHTGSSVKLWTGLANHAQKEGGAFFIFPGGKLAARTGTEKLRNSIYSLANAENLDGLISWASTLGGDVSLEELTAFHAQYENLPYVTIGQKIGNHAAVEFDAYSGMKELVEHIVHHHGAKRIAFLRGPENHTSANDRYRAFVDVLTEANLYTDEAKNLVSDCFAWNDGLNAMRQLCEYRNLKPGRDFDAVIASSDMMALAAVNWLELFGCRIPEDVLVAGFNNSVESQLSPVPFSTVHMPYEELGLEANKLLAQVLKGEKKIPDRLLPAYPVIRESCGCHTLESLLGETETVVVQSRAEFIEKAKSIFRKSKGISEKRIEKMTDALFDENQQEAFLTMVTETLNRYFERGGELSKVFQILKLLRHTTCLPPERIETVLRTVNIIIPKVQEQIFSLKQYENTQVANALSTLKSELLAVHERGKLISVLEKYLPLIGIYLAAIVLYENGELSQYAGGFNSSGELLNETILFPANMLVPPKFNADFEEGVFVVQPLLAEDRALGYLILGYSECDGTLYEDLRHAISSALQSVFLFEEMSSAKQTAEQAERAKTEFFATVGSDLCDPLKDLSAKISQMESNVEKGILDADILSEQLLFLKSQIASQLEKTETLVDLTKTQVEDLPTDKKLFDLRLLLPKRIADRTSDDIPLLFGDAEKLRKALEILFSVTDENVAVSVHADGVHIHLDSARLDWQKPELLLAEKSILLQYGEVIKSEGAAAIVLPLPNLAGTVPVRAEKRPQRVYNVSAENKRKTLLSLPVEKLDKETATKQEEGSYLLFWEPDATAIDEWIKLYGLRHNDALCKAPLLCYDRSLAGKTFMSALAEKVSEQKKTTVLFINAKQTRYGTWATDENSIEIASMDEFDKIIEEITPTLIVFERIDEAGIKKIRRNQKTVLVPILIFPDTIDSEEELDALCAHPRIILCNRGAADSDLFGKRVEEILAGDEILPSHTGALVKKAILYLNKNAGQQIVRWKLADTVHVSEDYLTRIFHKEIGLSLWEYLNRYRIYMATKMLLETNDTIYEIAEKSGFQDQAYFCRVFKKIYGVPPGKLRAKQ